MHVYPLTHDSCDVHLIFLVMASELEPAAALARPAWHMAVIAAESASARCHRLDHRLFSNSTPASQR